MGKRADTKALAGAARAGVPGAQGSLTRNVPELELVTSPKRQAILDGMLEAVGAEGYEQTSVRTVLDRTGVYRQAFYDNFTDKDDCYLQALEAGLERFEAHTINAAEGQEDWIGQLRAGLAALLALLEGEADVGRALIVEVHAAGPEALALRTAAMERVNAFLDRARAEAGEGEAPPAIAGEGVGAGIHAVIHARLASGAGDGFADLLPEFMYFAVLPFFGAERAREAMAAQA